MQADYARDFLTICFSHPAIRGFLMWGFWEGAHYKPIAAMIRRDWSTKPNYTVWNDLLYNRWWTDERGTTGPDDVWRTRGRCWMRRPVRRCTKLPKESCARSTNWL